MGLAGLACEGAVQPRVAAIPAVETCVSWGGGVAGCAGILMSTGLRWGCWMCWHYNDHGTEVGLRGVLA